MNYESIFSTGFKTPWRHKAQWNWGNIYAIATGVPFIYPAYIAFFTAIFLGLRYAPMELENLSALDEDRLSLIFGTIAIVFSLVMLVLRLLMPLASGALISNARQVLTTDTSPTFRDGFNAGKSIYLRLLGQRILLFLLLALIIGIVIAPFIAFLSFSETVAIDAFENSSSSAEITFILLFYIVIIGASMAVGLLAVIFHIFGSRAIVLEGYSARASFRRSLQVLWQNLGSFLITGLLMYAAYYALNFLIMIPILIGVIGAALIFVPQSFSIGMLIVGIFINVFAALLLTGMYGYLYSFSETVWTQWYLERTTPNPVDAPDAEPPLLTADTLA